MIERGERGMGRQESEGRTKEREIEGVRVRESVSECV